MKKKLLFTAGVALVAVLISGALVGVALADNPTDGKNGPQQAFLSKVARILGLQEQQIKDAAKQAGLEMVDDAVAARKLTEEQANRLKERIEKGGVWGPPNILPRNPGQGLPKGLPNVQDLQHLFQIKALADFLGMKPVDLTNELKQGKTLAQIAVEHGKSRDQVEEAIISAFQKRLDQAVAKGVLKKERADQMVKKAGEAIDKLLDRSFKGKQLPGQPGPRVPDILNEVKLLTDYLGMKPAEMVAQLRQGKTLAQIGEEHGKSRDDLKQAILSRLQKRADEAVANGKLTKEKAAEMMEKAAERVDKLLDASLKNLKWPQQSKPQAKPGRR